MNPSYSRPPLIEALLDIRVDLPGDMAIDKLLKCQQRVKADYPDRKEYNEVRGRVSVGQEVTASASTKPMGYVFSSADNRQLFQARLDGFTYNRLEPYLGWQSFLREAKRLWGEYYRVTHPRGYKRVALRFINRFDFPVSMVKLDTYFRTGPEIADDLPQTMGEFFFRVVLPLPEITAAVIITQLPVEPPVPGQVSIVLDIDLFRTESLPSGNELWPLFETLRTWKNKVFEASITDATRDLIR